jgi:hypothetical protein
VGATGIEKVEDGDDDDDLHHEHHDFGRLRHFN